MGERANQTVRMKPMAATRSNHSGRMVKRFGADTAFSINSFMAAVLYFIDVHRQHKLLQSPVFDERALELVVYRASLRLNVDELLQHWGRSVQSYPSL
jgi:hypothetical protein